MMFASLVDPVFVGAAQAGLSLILLVGGVQKLSDASRFESAVAGYALLPDALVSPVARFIPLLECLGGALLLTDASRLLGVALAVGLLLAVTAAVVANLVRGRADIDCGCSGATHAKLSWALPARNACLIALAFLAGSTMRTRAMEALDYASIGCAALAILALYCTANELLANQPLISSLRRLSR